MKIKILIGVLVFLIVVNLATIGSYLYLSWRHGHEEPFPPDRMMPPLMEQLNPEQRKMLFNLIKQFYDETRPANDRARALEQETFSLMHQDSIPHDRINKDLDEIAALRLDVSKRAAKHLVEAKSILTPAQFEIFLGAIMQNRPAPPGGRPGERGPHFPMPFGHPGDSGHPPDDFDRPPPEH